MENMLFPIDWQSQKNGFSIVSHLHFNNIYYSIRYGLHIDTISKKLSEK